MSHPNVVSSSQSHSPSPIIAYEVYKTCAKDIIHAPTPSSCTKRRKCTSRTSYTLCVCAPTPDNLTHVPRRWWRFIIGMASGRPSAAEGFAHENVHVLTWVQRLLIDILRSNAIYLPIYWGRRVSTWVRSRSKSRGVGRSGPKFTLDPTLQIVHSTTIFHRLRKFSNRKRMSSAPAAKRRKRVNSSPQEECPRSPEVPQGPQVIIRLLDADTSKLSLSYSHVLEFERLEYLTFNHDKVSYLYTICAAIFDVKNSKINLNHIPSIESIDSDDVMINWRLQNFIVIHAKN